MVYTTEVTVRSRDCLVTKPLEALLFVNHAMMLTCTTWHRNSNYQRLTFKLFDQMQ